jgi:hypothetical protein
MRASFPAANAWSAASLDVHPVRGILDCLIRFRRESYGQDDAIARHLSATAMMSPVATPGRRPHAGELAATTAAPWTFMRRLRARPIDRMAPLAAPRHKRGLPSG